jgi:phosphotransferase system  glucose/maltose/N-acetylglucosamine-specific IIC component
MRTLFENCIAIIAIGTLLFMVISILITIVDSNETLQNIIKNITMIIFRSAMIILLLIIAWGGLNEFFPI